ncbi:hypothetical protein SNE510_55800 [Streptomyces sp. NE5-10]|nr:hypothetical protein SNE510_55800 [Streptomyces sp. NE5-10]
MGHVREEGGDGPRAPEGERAAVDERRAQPSAARGADSRVCRPEISVQTVTRRSRPAIRASAVRGGRGMGRRTGGAGDAGRPFALY